MTTARGALTRSKPTATRYELGEPFASGGMGVIRRGFDRWASREIAHKRLRVDREEQRPRISALFEREYDTLARLKHPNIVDVYDYGFDAQGAYYVMEWLSGDDLSKRAPLPYREACGVLRDVASALALLHTRRFVHRDVSPNNVRLTRSGVAKLIDFGALTSFGRPAEIAGTPAFIAPECLRDQDLDQRTDIYGLGALAYWTLSGRPAVRAQSIAQLLDAIEAPVTPLAHQVPDVPEALHELVHAMLSHDRAQRPDNASEVIDRLTAIGELAPEREERKVAYSYLKHPPLQGRTEALGELQRALEAVLQGRGSVLAIEGGVGLGRSALLEQLTIDAQLRGATVLRAEGGAETGGHGLARRLIQQGLRIYPELEGSDAFFRRMVDNGETARSAMEPLERTAQAATRLRKWLLSLCERGPLVIAIDDADLADDESLGLLASLSQDDERGPIPLLLAISTCVGRDTGGMPLSRLLLGARRLSLATLEEAEVVALLTGVFGNVPNARRLAQWLHGETGGNPAQTIDLLRLLIRQGAVRYQRGTFSLPHDIDPGVARERRHDALLTRVAGLSADAGSIMELLCLHQGSLSIAQLCDAASLTPREVSLALEQLVHRAVVYAPGDAVSLRGESLRAVIARALDADRLRDLHLELARAIELHPEQPLSSELSVAAHLFHAGEHANAAGRIMALLAQHGHDVPSYAESVTLLEAALRHYEGQPGCEPECTDLLAALATSGYYGNLEAQRTYLRPALRSLARQCGFDVAHRLGPYLGAHVALLLGCLFAILFQPFMRRRLGTHRIQKRIAALYAVALSGSAVAATTADDESTLAIADALRPTRGFPAWSVPGLARDFVMATNELSELRTHSAARRYERVLAATEKPRLFLEERLRLELRLGCMNGRGHAYAGRADAVALAMADQMEKGSAFFAVHAEVIRVLYYAMIGQHDLSEQHRQRAEVLALRGGASWTAASTLSARLIEVAIAYGDSATLMRVEAETERLVKWIPSMERRRKIARARLLILRGNAQQAAELIEPELADASALAWRDAMRTLYADALCHLGAFEHAREQALAVVRDTPPEQWKFGWILRSPFLPLARAEIGLGNHERARELMLEQLEHADARNNPLELGIVHRELASIALASRDTDAFDRHLALMTSHFRATQHPNLARQRELLLARAVSAGIKETPTGTWTSSCETSLDSATIVEPHTSRRLLPNSKD
ncbi:MAG TPA: serine/threonine-protein kinase [Polyangiales bacterium]|nr:serine/threonine-protein kinase [Polyangiales bacterium]